jgi:polyisoprenoid-binding protein YceI
MNTSKTSLLLALGLSLAGGRALAENTVNAKTPQLTEWVLDAAHTHVGFSVPHMVVSEVEGKFDKFSGKVLLDEADPAKSQVEFTAETASIDTGVAKRDEHLVGADFFDAAKFPAITFKSVSIAKAGKGYKIQGDLTIRGVTKRVTLDATLSAPMQSPFGQQVRAAKLTGTISREAFGITWNKALDKGGVLVGDKVALEIKAELNK